MLVKKLGAALVAGVTLSVASSVAAQDVEISRLGDLQIALHLHPFLTETEVLVLRTAAQNRDALSVLVPAGSTIAALAIAPSEGFIRDGDVVDSAKAVRDLPNLATARSDALSECNGARQRGPACVIVLEISPN